MKKRGPLTEIYKQVQENVVEYLTNNFFSILDQMEGGNKVSSLFQKRKVRGRPGVPFFSRYT